MSKPKTTSAKASVGFARFLSLWAQLFFVVILLAGFEGVVFYARGYQYSPATSLYRVNVADLSIDSHGEWAAARIRLKRNDNTSIWSDVVLVNLQHQTVVPLDVRHLEPQFVALSPDTRSMAIACNGGVIVMIQNPTSGKGATKGHYPRFTTNQFGTSSFHLTVASWRSQQKITLTSGTGKTEPCYFNNPTAALVSVPRRSRPILSLSSRLTSKM